jgi:hypothetical protein
MISALAKAYQATGKQLYLDAAEKAADFIHDRLYDDHNRQLYRIWRQGERKISGLASDYSNLIQGLIDLYESGFRYHRLEWAGILAAELIRLFSDHGRGGLFMTREDHDQYLLMRIKEEGDSVLPAAGSIAAHSLWKLSRYTGNEDFRSRAGEIAISALGNPNLHASSVPQMLVTQAAIESDPAQVVIAGEKTDPDTRALIQAVHRANHPGKIVFLADEDRGWKQVCSHDFLQDVKPVNGRPAAYMCVNQTCQKPVTDSGELAKMLIRTETGEPNKPVLP